LTFTFGPTDNDCADTEIGPAKARHTQIGFKWGNLTGGHYQNRLISFNHGLKKRSLHLNIAKVPEWEKVRKGMDTELVIFWSHRPLPVALPPARTSPPSPHSKRKAPTAVRSSDVSGVLVMPFVSEKS
jgi:hypothetical protein